MYAVALGKIFEYGVITFQPHEIWQVGSVYKCLEIINFWKFQYKIADLLMIN